MYRAQRGHGRSTGVKAEDTGRWTQHRSEHLGDSGRVVRRIGISHFTLKVINF